MEENPFEDPKIAQEWINWAETKDDSSRYTETYPRVRSWLQKTKARTVVDIGAGQGILSEYLGSNDMEYIGVEPSIALVERAKSLHKEKNKTFVIGNAYELPLADQSADAAFSINVWFHLRDLEKASQELSRVLKSSGKFLIITGNPKVYDTWKTFFVDPEEEKGDVIVSRFLGGRDHRMLSRHRFYLHPLGKIKGALEDNNLTVDEIDNFGHKRNHNDEGLFISVKGHKE